MPGKVLAFKRYRGVDCEANASANERSNAECSRHDCAMFEPVNQSRSRSYVDIMPDGTIRYSLRVHDRRELLRLIAACQILQDRLVARLSSAEPE